MLVRAWVSWPQRFSGQGVLEFAHVPRKFVAVLGLVDMPVHGALLLEASVVVLIFQVLDGVSCSSRAPASLRQRIRGPTCLLLADSVLSPGLYAPFGGLAELASHSVEGSLQHGTWVAVRSVEGVARSIVAGALCWQGKSIQFNLC